MKLGGIILCGGRSRRMGTAKAWLRFADEYLLQRVVRIVGQAADPVVVVGAPGQDLPELPAGITILRDEVGGRGPLQGMAAGLRALRSQVDAAYVCGTDGPFLTAAFIRRMAELLGRNSIAVPRLDERYHPLSAVYAVTVLPEVERLLAEGRLRPALLFDSFDTRVVTRDDLVEIDPELRCLVNLNTPGEYERAVLQQGGADQSVSGGGTAGDGSAADGRVGC